MSDPIPENITQIAVKCLEESRAVSFAKLYARYPEVIFVEGVGVDRRPLWQRYENLVVIAPQAIPEIIKQGSPSDLPILAGYVAKNPALLAISLINNLNQNLFQHEFFRLMSAADLSPLNMLLDAGINLGFLSQEAGQMTSAQRFTCDAVKSGGGIAILLLNTNVRNMDECELIIRKMVRNGYPLDLGKPVIKCIGNTILKDRAFDTMILLMRSGYQFSPTDIEKASKYLDDTQLAEISKNSIKIAIRDAVAEQEKIESNQEPVLSKRRNRIDL